MAKKEDGRPWADIQHDFENTTEPVPQLCGRYGITRDMLYGRIKRYNWKRRNPRKKKFDALARLKQLARRKIELLEGEEQTGGNAAASDAEIARMTALARLIERIATLEQKEKAAERTATPPRLVDNARRLELARRLDALRRQLESEGNLPRPEGA